MSLGHVEYLGFGTTAAAREYRLRVRQGTEAHDFTLTIANDAFLRHRLRYQDGPGICFVKLQKELAGCADGLPAAILRVTDAELEEYRSAHAPKLPQRRPKAPPVV